MFRAKTMLRPCLLQQNPYFLPLPQGQIESGFQGTKRITDIFWESISYRLREIKKDEKTRTPLPGRTSNLFDSISSEPGSLGCIALPQVTCSQPMMGDTMGYWFRCFAACSKTTAGPVMIMVLVVSVLDRSLPHPTKRTEAGAISGGI